MQCTLSKLARKTRKYPRLILFHRKKSCIQEKQSQSICLRVCPSNVQHSTYISGDLMFFRRKIATVQSLFLFMGESRSYVCKVLYTGWSQQPTFWSDVYYHCYSLFEIVLTTHIYSCSFDCDFRLIWNTPRAVEIYPGDGSSMRSTGLSGHFFTHYIPKAGKASFHS